MSRSRRQWSWAFASSMPPRNVRLGEIIRGLMLIHEVLEAEEMAGRVEFL